MSAAEIMATDKCSLQKFNVTKDDYEPSVANSRAVSIDKQMPFQDWDQFFKQYKPHLYSFDMSILHSSEHRMLKKIRSSVYYGQIVNGCRHGLGIMVYSDGRIYEGQWQNDQKHGQGYEQFANGCSYQGDYVNGKPEGVGRQLWLNGELYEGEWLNGVKHGPGMWKGAKGDSYVGEWRLGKADGFGVHTWINGDRYEGEFHQCKKHGQGTEKFVNGDLYKGGYSQGKPQGFGEYYWPNGSYYKGNFHLGLRHGHGVWKKGSGNTDKYQGEYFEDHKHGYGIFTWADGHVYKGNYEMDLRNGYGEIYWNDGSYYKGEWKAGIQHGAGIMYTPDEGLRKGVFKNNMLIEAHKQNSRPAKAVSLKPYSTKSVKSRGSALSGHREYSKSLQGRGQKLKSGLKLERRKFPGQRQPEEHSDTKALPGEARFTSNNRSRPLPPSRLDDLHIMTGKMKALLNDRLEPDAKKERIPHSAFCMHKFHKRVSTAQRAIIRNVGGEHTVGPDRY